VSQKSISQRIGERILGRFIAILIIFVVFWIIFGGTDRVNKKNRKTNGILSSSIQEPPPEFFASSASLIDIQQWADKGSPTAQEYLGYFYYHGTGGVKLDIFKGIKYLTLAANQGRNAAALRLWRIYDTGNPPLIKADQSEARRWLSLAAGRGDSTALCLLGLDSLWRKDGLADQAKAFAYLNKAAEAGSIDAVYWISECYSNGWGIKSDASRAIQYLTSAADSEASFAMKSRAQCMLAEAYKYGYYVGKNPQRAFEYFQKSALLGYNDAQGALVRAYINGSGVVPSTGSALVWVYVNRATGGYLTAELASMMESEFDSDSLAIIRGKAREIVNTIEAIKSNDVVNSGGLQHGTREKATGTGVVVSSSGIIVTAAHVINGAKKIEVAVNGAQLQATVLEIDARNDLAILRIGGSGWTAAPIAPSRDVRLGQSVFTIGYPNTDIQGSSPKFTKGEISSLCGMQDEPTQWQISVPVQSGNSGSPLFDEAGNVVGVVVSKLNALETAKTTGDLAQNVNYAVKNAYLVPMLEKFQDKLPSSRKRGFFKSFESIVEDSKKSVVLILAY
jgi:TPR repeat protein